MNLIYLKNTVKKHWKEDSNIRMHDYIETGEGIITEAFDRLEKDLERYELTYRRGLAEGRRREKATTKQPI